jgi:tRNA(Ile)-lysidine synthase
LPGPLFLHIEEERLWLGPSPAPAEFPLLEEPLVLHGEGRVAGRGVEIEVDAVGREALPEHWPDLPPTHALLDAEALRWPLTVRRPGAGERWQPLGMAGQSVGLESWLASHGVPAHLRDQASVLVGADGAVLWVVGLQVGHHARVRPESDRLWLIVVRAAPSSITLDAASRAERMP